MSRAAFSLIELLVVITIIVVIAAMLLPAIGAVRSMAKCVECLGRQRQVGLAILSYTADNHGLFPPSGYYQAAPGGSLSLRHWLQALVSPTGTLTGDERIYMCSEDPRRLTSSILTSNWRGQGVSIGYNYQGLGGDRDGIYGFAIGGVDPPYWRPAQLAELGNPAETVVTGDSNACGQLESNYPSSGGGGLYPRHRNGWVANVLCADGHVFSMRAGAPYDPTRFYAAPALGGFGDPNAYPQAWCGGNTWWDRN